MARLEFTRKTKREALFRAKGQCEASGPFYNRAWDDPCRKNLGLGVQFDHFILASEGGDNSLDNCRAVCPSCHSWKTRNIDTPKAAKIKRIRRNLDPETRKKSKKPIVSRGFDKMRKKKFSGEVVSR